MNYAHKHAQEGFTLIEILIAFALVMIMGGVVFVSYRGYCGRKCRKSDNGKYAGYSQCT